VDDDDDDGRGVEGRKVVSEIPLCSPAHSLWKEILQRRRRKGVCRNPMMIEDDEALKHQENGPPGGKQTLANSLKRGRREQEGIETRCVRFATRKICLKAFGRTRRGKENRHSSSSSSQHSTLRHRSRKTLNDHQVLIRVPKTATVNPGVVRDPNPCPNNDVYIFS